MNPTEITIASLADLPVAAARLAELIAGRTIVAFYGGMGAGKTTLIRALCAHLGVTDEVTSPTFAIVNEYATPADGSIYHFDFYRINSISEVYDIGYEDYFYSGRLCLLEWPELIEPLLPDDTVAVHIDTLPTGGRIVRVG